MFSIWFALEFGVRQFILPEMVAHFRYLPVASRCFELYQTIFVFLSFFGLTSPQSSSKTPCLFIYDFFVIVFIYVVNVSIASELFSWPLPCFVRLSSGSSDCCSSSKHSPLRSQVRINFFFCTTQFIKTITNFIVSTILVCQPIVYIIQSIIK